MDALTLIKSRRTIRRYSKKAVSPGTINKIIEAGMWAPSPHNCQPWHFVVIANGKTKRSLMRRLSVSSGSLLSSVKPLFDRTLAIMKRAPVVVLVYNNRSFSRRMVHLDEPYLSVSRLSEIEGISAAIQNMQLMAFSSGIGMAWLNMPLLAAGDIDAVMKSRHELVAVLAMGHPAEKGSDPGRKKISDLVSYSD